MAIQWQKDWSAAKKFFKAETGKRKPDAKVTGIIGKHETGLDSLIKKVEKSMTDFNATKTQQTFAAYRAHVASFKTAKDNYTNTLQQAIDKEIADKDTKTVYSKACTYLVKQLTSIHASMEGQVGWAESALKQESMSAATANNALTSIEGAARKCAAALAKVKVDPTPKAFRDELATPARDLSQFIGNIPLLRKKGFTFPAGITDQRAKALYDVIRPYGDGKMMQILPDTKSTDEVLLEVKKLTNAVKAAAELVKA